MTVGLVPKVGDTVHLRRHPGPHTVVSVEQYRAGLVKEGSKGKVPDYYGAFTDLSSEPWPAVAVDLNEEVFGVAEELVEDEPPAEEKPTTTAPPAKPPRSPRVRVELGDQDDEVIGGDEDGNV